MVPPVHNRVQSFRIGLNNQTRLILVALRANGVSSYRDASAMSRLFHERFGACGAVIITDCRASIRDVAPGCSIVEVPTGGALLSAIRDAIACVPPASHLVFSMSAHGYSKPVVPRRAGMELNGMTEYVRVGSDHVLDVDLFHAVYGPMDESVKSLCLIDTCHSGTMLDLEYLSADGISFQRSKTPLQGRPESVCISACNDMETAGEDISDYAGWGGKLTCHFLDFITGQETLLDPLKFYRFIRVAFSQQTSQRSQPIISFSDLNLT